MKPYTAAKVADLIEVARVAADMLLGGYHDHGLEDNRVAVFSKDTDALSAALDRVSAAWFSDIIESKRPFERVTDAIDREEGVP